MQESPGMEEIFRWRDYSNMVKWAAHLAKIACGSWLRGLSFANRQLWSAGHALLLFFPGLIWKSLTLMQILAALLENPVGYSKRR